MKKIIVSLILTTILTSLVQAQLLLNDFSDWEAINPNGGFTSGTWTGNVIQNSGFITVGGTADNTGNVYLDFIGINPKNLTSFTGLSLTARNDAGNAGGSFIVLIVDDLGEDAAQAYFLNSSFTSSFTTVTVSWTVLNPSKLANAGGFFIFGSGTPDDFRMSFDGLSAVPEPSTYLLLGLGGVGFWLARRWRRVK